MMPAYSIRFTVQRVTREYSYVSVPVTEDLMVEQPDGTFRLNGEMTSRRAVDLAQAPEVKWYAEEQEIRLHPIQKVPEPDER